MIDLNNLTTTEIKLEELDLFVDPDNYLEDLSEQEKANNYGGRYSGEKSFELNINIRVN